MRVVKWSLLGALVVALVGGAVLFVRRPASTPALRGLRVAEELGCFACHMHAEANEIVAMVVTSIKSARTTSNKTKTKK